MPTHTVVLPYIATLVEEALPGVLRPVADARAPTALPDGLHALAARIGAPTSLRQIGLHATDVAGAAKLTAREAPPQVPVDEPTLHDLLMAAYEGEPP